MFEPYVHIVNPMPVSVILRTEATDARLRRAQRDRQFVLIAIIIASGLNAAYLALFAYGHWLDLYFSNFNLWCLPVLGLIGLWLSVVYWIFGPNRCAVTFRNAVRIEQCVALDQLRPALRQLQPTELDAVEASREVGVLRLPGSAVLNRSAGQPLPLDVLIGNEWLISATLIALIGWILLFWGVSTEFRFGYQQSVLWDFLPITIVLPTTCIGIFMIHRMKRAKITISADPTGLIWETRQGAPSLPVMRWGDADRFYCYRRLYRNHGETITDTTYALHAPNATYFWMAQSPYRRIALTLAQSVAWHTGLPLLDATPAYRQLRAARWNARKANDPHVVDPLTIAARRMTISPDQQPRRQWLAPGLLTLPLAALVLLTFIAPLWRTPYFTSLHAAIIAERPVYVSTLMTTQSYFTVPSSEQSTVMSVTPAGLNLHASNIYSTEYALSTSTIRDAAVQVTVNGGGGGFILRLSGNRYIEVAVGASYLRNGTAGMTVQACLTNETTLGTENSFACDDIFTSNTIDPTFPAGPNGANTLLVLMRGGTFIFFVNDQYAGAFVNLTGQIPASGQIGLFSDYDPVTFTNFAVYPLPNNLPPWVVA